MHEKQDVVFGSNSANVISNITRRAEQLRSGNPISDGRKIALVIEGGGMRSVYSGAGAAALAQMGLNDVFDEVYATSAGVMNASYFLTNQPLVGMSVYFENCTTKSFLNPLRLWKILDVDYIIDRVVSLEKPLNLGQLAATRTAFFVSVCDKQTGEVILIETNSTSTPVLQVLKAAMAIPVFYNRDIDIGGRSCIDSGTVLPFPLTHALERGCTDLLVLSTRSASFVEMPPKRSNKFIFNLCQKQPGLRDSFAARHEQSQLVRDLAMGRTALPSGTNVATICPDDGIALEYNTTKREITHPAAIQYGRKTMLAFGRNPNDFVLSDLIG